MKYLREEELDVAKFTARLLDGLDDGVA